MENATIRTGGTAYASPSVLPTDNPVPNRTKSWQRHGMLIGLSACVSGCGAGGPTNADEALREMVPAIIGAEPAAYLSELAVQITQQIISQAMPMLSFGNMSEDAEEIEVRQAKLKNWDDAAIEKKIDTAVAPYKDQVSDVIYRTMAAAMPEKDIIALHQFAFEGKNMAALNCVFDPATVSPVPQWDECSKKYDAIIPKDRQQQYSQLMKAIGKSASKPLPETVFGDAACIVAREFSDEMSTENFSFKLEDIKLTFGEGEAKGCGEFKGQANALLREQPSVESSSESGDLK